jgi:Polysaccharide deacetylase
VKQLLKLMIVLNTAWTIEELQESGALHSIVSARLTTTTVLNSVVSGAITSLFSLCLTTKTTPQLSSSSEIIIRLALLTCSTAGPQQVWLPPNKSISNLQSVDYCAAPNCQFNYGPACDANKIPAGTNTSSIPRTQLGSVLYGSEGIYDCVNPGDMALTFDDGPFIYTSHILDVLAQYNASATFFITGNNNGELFIHI